MKVLATGRWVWEGKLTRVVGRIEELGEKGLVGFVLLKERSQATWKRRNEFLSPSTLAPMRRTFLDQELVKSKGELLGVLLHEGAHSHVGSVLSVVAELDERAEVAVSLCQLVGMVDLVDGDWAT